MSPGKTVVEIVKHFAVSAPKGIAKFYLRAEKEGVEAATITLSQD